MPAPRSRIAGYVVTALVCVPLAAGAYVVAGYVGWLGVVVAAGLSLLGVLVRAQNSARITQRHLAILRSRTKPKSA